VPLNFPCDMPERIATALTTPPPASWLRRSRESKTKIVVRRPDLTKGLLRHRKMRDRIGAAFIIGSFFDGAGAIRGHHARPRPSPAALQPSVWERAMACLGHLGQIERESHYAAIIARPEAARSNTSVWMQNLHISEPTLSETPRSELAEAAHNVRWPGVITRIPSRIAPHADTKASNKLPHTETSTYPFGWPHP